MAQELKFKGFATGDRLDEAKLDPTRVGPILEISGSLYQPRGANKELSKGWRDIDITFKSESTSVPDFRVSSIEANGRQSEEAWNAELQELKKDNGEPKRIGELYVWGNPDIQVNQNDQNERTIECTRPCMYAWHVGSGYDSFSRVKLMEKASKKRF